MFSSPTMETLRCCCTITATEIISSISNWLEQKATGMQWAPAFGWLRPELLRFARLLEAEVIFRRATYARTLESESPRQRKGWKSDGRVEKCRSLTMSLVISFISCRKDKTNFVLSVPRLGFLLPLQDSCPETRERPRPSSANNYGCLINVPSCNSCSACCSSCWVFITIGPYHATGSSIGLPETSRKRIPSGPAFTTISSPRSNSTKEWFVASYSGGASGFATCSVRTARGSDESRNVPDTAKT